MDNRLSGHSSWIIRTARTSLGYSEYDNTHDDEVLKLLEEKPKVQGVTDDAHKPTV